MRSMIMSVCVCFGHAAISQTGDVFNAFVHEENRDSTQVFAHIGIADNVSYIKPDTRYRSTAYGLVPDEKPRKFRHQLRLDLLLAVFPRFGHAAKLEPHVFVEGVFLRTYIGAKFGGGVTFEEFTFGVLGGNYYRMVDEYEVFKFRTKNFERSSVFGGYVSWDPLEFPVSVLASRVFEKSIENTRGYTKAILVGKMGRLINARFIPDGLEASLEWESFLGRGFGLGYRTPNGKFRVGTSFVAPEEGEQRAQSVLGNTTGPGCKIDLSFIIH